MAPSEHIRWFENNIRWYERLEVGQLHQAVPSCPGWSVEDVLNHLSRGLALAYPVAMTTPPERPPERVFDRIDWPGQHRTGAQALAGFSAAMSACLRGFNEIDPNQRCWTYEGDGIAAFWLRRAAVESTLHRMDVAEALELDQRHLDDARCADAIVETLGFALPLAGRMTRTPEGRIVVETSCLDGPLAAGAGVREARITGESHDVLGALWGRNRERITVSGDSQIAAEWLTSIETAFAGR